MNTGKLIVELLKFGSENKIKNITRIRPLLLLIKKDLGHKNARKITPLDIHNFFKNRVSNYKDFFAPPIERWNSRYEGRYLIGREKKLPWELTKPEKELRKFIKGKSMKGTNVLDLGCGDGLHSIFLAKLGANVTAVDISHSAIKVAKANALKERVKCKFLVSDIFDLDFGKKRFDLILDKHCFHHVPVPRYHEYKLFIHKHLEDTGTFFLIAHTHNRFVERVQDLHLGFFSRLLKYICDNVSVSGFTINEIKTIFFDRFQIKEIKITHDDDLNRDLQFVSAKMTKKSNRSYR